MHAPAAGHSFRTAASHLDPEAIADLRIPLLPQSAEAEHTAPRPSGAQVPRDAAAHTPTAAPSVPPPGYPGRVAAALVLPGYHPDEDPTDAHPEGSRGLGTIIGRPAAELGNLVSRPMAELGSMASQSVAELGAWVDLRAERLETRFVNGLRKCARGGLTVASAALIGTSTTLFALWWGISLSEGYISPFNPDGHRHRNWGLAIVLGTFPTLIFPAAGALVGLRCGRVLSRLVLPDLTLPTGAVRSADERV